MKKIRFVAPDIERRAAPAPYVDEVKAARARRQRAASGALGQRHRATLLFLEHGERRELPTEAPVYVNGTPWWKEQV